MQYEIKSNLRKISGEIDDKYLQKYVATEVEDKFFDEVYKTFGEGISLIRMSDGTLDVSYNGYPIGKIKLRGRKYSMQILKRRYGIISIEGSAEEFIPYITDWKKYADSICK